jgi:signal transduction histidine kinase
VEVADVVDRVVGAARTTSEEKEAEVIIADDLPPAWGDASAVEQLFANLIGNALKYLDEKRLGLIEVGGEGPIDENGLNTYYVRDNGVGIPEEQRAMVFQIFQRLDSRVRGWS